jgi:hypothetical protein
MAVYWVEIAIKKKDNLSEVMRELNLMSLDKTVYLEKQFLAWDASSSKIYKKFL